MKSIKKKGGGIVEVVCSLMLISIIFAYVMQIHLELMQVKNYLEVKDNYSRLLEALSLELQYNKSYQDIVNIYLQGKVYIAKDKLNFDNIEKDDIANNMTDTVQSVKPYVFIDMVNDKVVTLKAKLFFKYLDKEEMIEWDFCKGNY